MIIQCSICHYFNLLLGKLMGIIVRSHCFFSDNTSFTSHYGDDGMNLVPSR